MVNAAVVRRAAARAMMSVGSLIGLPFRQLGGLMRRDQSLVVIGSLGGRFAGNPRYLFVALSGDDALECVWITGDRATRDEVRAMGHRAELRWSVAGVRVCLRAGWYVYGSYLSDINYWTSKGARTLNLWHGVGIKAVEFAITKGPLLRVYSASRWSPIRLAFIDRFHRPDYFLSTSRFVTDRCFKDAFRLPTERFLEFGYPRTDHFFDDDAPTRARSLIAPAADIEEIIGYFPTWRDQGNDFIAESGFSFDVLNEVMARRRRLLVFKAHPNFSYVTPSGTSWSNIVVLDAAADLNRILPGCDAIITDYSSVAYDFLLLGRPVIFFVPDYDRYVANRNANFSFDDMAVGPIIKDVETLYRTLDAPSMPVVDAEHQASVRRQLWNGYAGDASVRIRDFLVDQSGTAAR